jgi:hypothetical protein
MTHPPSIEARIFLLRGHRVLLDSDLALLYGVLTKRLNDQVRRNLSRFPSDFGFPLTEKELRLLRPQMAGSRGGRRPVPWVFTEQGALMLAGVLPSDVAIKVGIEIVRAFVLLREGMGGQIELAKRIDDLESRCDGQSRGVFEAIRGLRTFGAGGP